MPINIKVMRWAREILRLKTHKNFIVHPTFEMNHYSPQSGCLEMVNIWRYLGYIHNSYPPSTAFMRQRIRPALVQIMACRLFGAKPLSNTVPFNWTLGNKPLWNFNQGTKLFIHENASENIACEMEATLSRVRWVKGILSSLTGSGSLLLHSIEPFC